MAKRAFDAIALWLEASRLRPYLLLAVDAAGAIGALALALLLRFEGEIDRSNLEALPRLMVFLGTARIFSNALLKLHRWSFRFSRL